MQIKNFSMESIKFNRCNLYSFVNPYSYYLIHGSEYENSFTYFADGILLVALNNLTSKNKIKRYSFDFTSLANPIFKLAEEKSLRVSLIGGTKEEVESAKVVITKKFPEINIVFAHHGYIKDSVSNVIGSLSMMKPEIIICGMGTPLQEEFLLHCKKRIPSLKLGFTCGGFLSQIASDENYFHPFFDRFHLRWLQRFVRHGYVRKRVLIDYPTFIFRFLKENVF